jgi:hypothetical protein
MLPKQLVYKCQQALTPIRHEEGGMFHNIRCPFSGIVSYNYLQAECRFQASNYLQMSCGLKKSMGRTSSPCLDESDTPKTNQ